MMSLKLLPRESGFGLACRTAIARSYKRFDSAHLGWKQLWPEFSSKPPWTGRQWADAGDGWWTAHLSNAERESCSLGHFHSALFAIPSNPPADQSAGGLPSAQALHCESCTRELLRQFGVPTWLRHHNAGDVRVCVDHGEPLRVANLGDVVFLPTYEARRMRSRNYATPIVSKKDFDYAEVVEALFSRPQLRSSLKNLKLLARHEDEDETTGFGYLASLLGVLRPRAWIVPKILRSMCDRFGSSGDVLKWFEKGVIPPEKEWIWLPSC